MKRIRLICIFLCICIVGLSAGCAIISASDEIAPPTSSPGGSPQKHASSEGEYGVPESRITYGKHYISTVFFPKTENQEINEVISKRAQQAETDAKSAICSTSGKNISEVDGEFNLDYTAQLSSSGIVGIHQFGWYSCDGQAAPVAISYTLNFDTKTGKLLAKDDLFTENGLSSLSTLCVEAAKKQLGEDVAISTPMFDSIDQIQITRTGIDVYFSKGSIASESAGAIKLSFSESQLVDILRFLGSSQPDATPKPSDNAPSSSPSERTLDPSKPMIAITFDDGPHGEITPQLLDLFNQNGGRATFCIVGSRIKGRESIIQRMAKESFEIGNHTWDHAKLLKMNREEIKVQIKSVNDKVFELTGKTPVFLRPTYGAFNDDMKSVTKELGMFMMNWTIDSEDWLSRDAETVYQKVMAEVKDGRVILCHDLYPSTLEAMKRIVPELTAQGYQLVTVSELMSCSEKPIEYGRVYRHR